MSDRFRHTMIAIAIGSLVPSAARAESSVDRLAWMSGCWRGVGEEAGSGEVWTSVAGGSLLGISRTVRGGRTIVHEFMRITDGPDGKAVFHAQPSGKPPASFTAIRLTATEVVFENPEHDFPQRVAYRLAAPDRIDASVEGTRGGVLRTIPYPLEKAPCPT